jgi:hypothetical protein
MAGYFSNSNFLTSSNFSVYYEPWYFQQTGPEICVENFHYFHVLTDIYSNIKKPQSDTQNVDENNNNFDSGLTD